MKPRSFYCRNALLLRCCMGLMTDGEMSFTESSIPAIVFNAFKSIAEVAPRRDEVLPVTICPSGSNAAVAGALVIFAHFYCRLYAFLSETETSSCFIKRSSLKISPETFSPVFLSYEGFVITSYNLLLCGVAYDLVVGYTKACHINAHIGG